MTNAQKRAYSKMLCKGKARRRIRRDELAERLLQKGIFVEDLIRWGYAIDRQRVGECNFDTYCSYSISVLIREALKDGDDDPTDFEWTEKGCTFPIRKTNKGSGYPSKKEQLGFVEE